MMVKEGQKKHVISNFWCLVPSVPVAPTKTEYKWKDVVVHRGGVPGRHCVDYCGNQRRYRGGVGLNDRAALGTRVCDLCNHRERRGWVGALHLKKGKKRRGCIPIRLPRRVWRGCNEWEGMPCHLGEKGGSQYKMGGKGIYAWWCFWVAPIFGKRRRKRTQAIQK